MKRSGCRNISGSLHDRASVCSRKYRKYLVKFQAFCHIKGGNRKTFFEVPECTTAAAILDGVKKDYNIMLAGSFDVLAGKVIRIGHMGNNATFYNVRDVFHALDGTLRKLGVPLTGSMEEIFCENMK